MRLLVIGAGGHAKVVIDAARAAGHEVTAVLDQGDRTELLGIPVLRDAGAVDADAFIVAIGENATRARIFEEHLRAGRSPATVVHPSAVIAEGVTLGAGTFVAAGVVVNIDARIGRNAILNTGCTVDHDCTIGDHTLIGPLVSLCGGVRIGDGTLLGAGASVIPTVSVGEWSVVGAGAAVVGDLPDRSTSVGVPARPIVRNEG